MEVEQQAGFGKGLQNAEGESGAANAAPRQAECGAWCIPEALLPFAHAVAERSLAGRKIRLVKYAVVFFDERGCGVDADVLGGRRALLALQICNQCRATRANLLHDAARLGRSIQHDKTGSKRSRHDVPSRERQASGNASACDAAHIRQRLSLVAGTRQSHHAAHSGKRLPTHPGTMLYDGPQVEARVGGSSRMHQCRPDLATQDGSGLGGPMMLD